MRGNAPADDAPARQARHSGTLCRAGTFAISIPAATARPSRRDLAKAEQRREGVRARAIRASSLALSGARWPAIAEYERIEEMLGR